ncbi:MAG: HAD family hydrolase [Halioglobus sp.]|nr:HAD family hydrolase [Halioglobus sp.]
MAKFFDDLRASGRTIAVLSDFPLGGKLDALELTADIAVAATDPEVGLAKPHPRGLELVIAQAGARAETTLMIGDRWSATGARTRGRGRRESAPSDLCQREGHASRASTIQCLAPLREQAAA